MGQVKDISGQIFGRLTVLSFDGIKRSKAMWRCQCTCGTIKTIEGKALRNGTSRSCGCLQRDIASSLFFKDLTGLRFGRLSIVRYYGRNNRKQHVWLCQCDCGNKVIVSAGRLSTGNTKSCGCFHKDVLSKRNFKHGMMRDERGRISRIYGIWCRMKQRCFYNRCTEFKDYGGRGITVCKEWLDYPSFHQWATSNGYKDNLSIERTDNDGNYEPSNCIWATPKVQANNKRNTRLITYLGMSLSLSQWAEKIGISSSLLKYRINNWTVDEALTLPVRRNSHGH